MNVDVGELARITQAYLRKRAHDRLPTSYSDINLHLHRKAKLPFVDVTKSPDRRTLLGEVLGLVNDLERADTGLLLAAYVTYSDGTLNSPGFDNYVRDQDLLPPGKKMAVFKTHCYEEVVQHYGKRI